MKFKIHNPNGYPWNSYYRLSVNNWYVIIERENQDILFSSATDHIELWVFKDMNRDEKYFLQEILWKIEREEMYLITL